MERDHINRVKKVSFLTGVDEKIVDEVIYLTTEYIKNKIEKIEIDPDEELMTKEEFEEKMPVFHLGTLGYLKPHYYRYRGIKRQIELKNKNKEKNGRKSNESGRESNE